MLRGALTGLVLFTLVLVALLLFFPFTALGTRILVEMLDSMTDMEIVYGSGSLSGELELERFVYREDDDSVTVIVRRPRATLDTGCLWRSAICLASLSASGLEVGVRSVEADPGLLQQIDMPNPFWPLPLPIETGDVVLHDVYIHWEGGELRSEVVSGAVNLQGKRVHVKNAIARNSVLLVSPEEEEPQEEAITLPDVDLPVRLMIDGARLESSTLDIAGQVQHIDSIEVAGQWRRTLMRLKRGKISVAEWGSAELSGTLDYRFPYTLDAKTEFALHEPAFWPQLDGSPGSLAVSGPLDNLAVQGELCGTFPLRFEGGLDAVSSPGWGTLRLAGGCTGQQRALQLAELPGLDELPDIRVAAGWRAELAGDSQSQTLQLELTASGFGYESMPVSLQAHHEAGELTVSRLLLGQGRTGVGELTGSLVMDAGMRGSADISLSEFPLPPAFPQAEGAVSGSLAVAFEYEEERWLFATSQMALEGEVNGLPSRLGGEFHLDQALNLDNTAAVLEVNGALLDLAAEPGLDPRLEVRITDLGRWAEPAAGSLEAELYWSQREQTIRAEGAVENAGWGQLQSRSLHFSAVHSLAPDRRSELAADFGQTRLGEIELLSASLDGSGDLSRQRLELQLNGDYTITVAIDGEYGGGDWRGVLQPATLVADQGVWVLDQAVPLDYLESSGQLAVADHCWLESEAKLCLRNLVLGVSGTAGLTLAGRLEPFSRLFPLRYEIAGAFDCGLQLEWLELVPQRVDLDLQVGQGSLYRPFVDGGRAEFYWDAVDLNYHGDLQQGLLNLQLRQQGRELLEMNLAMPATRQGDLDGKVALEDFDLELLMPFLTGVSDLQGTVGGELVVSGAVDSPELVGALDLSNGLLALVGNPTVVEVPQLKLLFRGRHAEITGLLQVDDGGSELTGRLAWLDGPSLDLHLEGDAKQVLYPPDTVVTVAENIDLQLRQDILRLKGRVEVPAAELVVPEIAEEGVPLSADVVLVDQAGNPVERPILFQQEIDLEISIADQAQLISDVVNARLGGNLQLRQSPGDPLQLFGVLKIHEGSVEVLGQRLRVTSGNVAFVGPPGSPQIDVSAEREITEDQVIVGVRVLGNLDQPKLEFYSRPPLPEAEVMAYLIGGRRIDRQGETNSLALALAMTSGMAQSRGFLRGIQLGVEGSDRTTRASVGGYISERIFLSYGVGLYEPFNTLTVRLYLLRQLWAEVVSGLHNSADLYYSWQSRN